MKALSISEADPREPAQEIAAFATSPTHNAAAVAQSFSIRGELDYFALQEAVADGCKALRDGNMERAQEMLAAQAHALDAIFTNLARRANAQERLQLLEGYLKLALRAQSQCRATLETLAAIKNPPVVFTKQANVSNGPMQVNNGVAFDSSHAGEKAAEKASSPIELLERDHGERLDTGTTGAAGRGDPIMETVGTLDGAAHGSGQGRGEP